MKYFKLIMITFFLCILSFFLIYIIAVNYYPSFGDDLTDIQKEEFKKLEIKCFLSNENDTLDSYLEFHAGAGGTESQDWAEMLSRMYQRFAEKNDYKYKIIDYQRGEEAGVKSVSMNIAGFKSYGYLKNESGIHRLVRISPFDSNKRRHTSFSSVWVYPEIEKDIEIDINPSGATGPAMVDNYAQVLQSAKWTYEFLLRKGVCPEQARMVLPQSMVTEWYWSGTLYAFARVCNLRCKPDAQEETRVIADRIDYLMGRLFPASWSALID